MGDWDARARMSKRKLAVKLHSTSQRGPSFAASQHCATCFPDCFDLALLLQMMEGRRPLKALQYVCTKDRKCGGLGDRLLGTVSAFLWSVLTSRAFTILWEDPIPFDLLFDSPHINWASPTSSDSGLATGSIFRDQSFVDESDENVNDGDNLDHQIVQLGSTSRLSRWSSFDISWIRVSLPVRLRYTKQGVR